MSSIQRILQRKKNLAQEAAEPQSQPINQWFEVLNSQTNIESSMRQWPSTPELKKAINVPLCLAIRPFEQLEVPQSQRVQNMNKVRCFSCKAFVSKLCYVSSQKSYDCSICGASNSLAFPLELESPAFQSMSYQIQVGDEHRLKPNTPPTLAFVIDISRKATKKGYLHNLVYSLKQFIKSIPNKNFFQIVIITYDQYPHYYDLFGKLVRRVIVTDECPEKDIQVLSKVEDKILEILDSLQELAAQNHIDSSNGVTNALEMAIQITRVYSGRILVFSGIEEVLPELSKKESQKNQSSTDNHRGLESKFMKSLKPGTMSVSFFMFNTSYVDLLSYHFVCKFTNGSLHHYQPHQALKFYYDLNTLLYSKDRYQVLMKVRSTPGIKLAGVFGSYQATNTNDQLKIYTCNQFKSYILEFNIQARINAPYSVVQFSTLFTTEKGQRKFRITNFVIPTQQNPMNCLSSIDYSVVNQFYIRASSQTLDTNMDPKIIRTIIQDRFGSHMKFCRQQLANNVANEQTSLYSNMTYCLLRSLVLNPPVHVSNTKTIGQDIFTYYRSLNLNGIFAELALIVHPLAFGVTADGQQILQLTVESIRNYPIVLLDRFVQLVVYLNPRADRLRQIFGKRIEVHLVTEEFLEQLQGDEIRVLQRLIETQRSGKLTGYQSIRFSSNIDQFMLFSVPGNFGYQNFISSIIK